jgi:hypothetical protein
MTAVVGEGGGLEGGFISFDQHSLTFNERCEMGKTPLLQNQLDRC